MSPNPAVEQSQGSYAAADRDCSLRLFETKGFDATTTKAIANASEFQVTKAESNAFAQLGG
jgi:hypothetical protein